MKNGWKIFFKCFGFLAIFIGIYAYMCFVLLPKDEKDLGYSKYYSAQSIKYEKNNTLDFIFYGNSDLYNGYSPMDFYEQTGSTSFAIGAGRQTVKRIKAQIKDNLKKQKPQAVIIETDCFYTQNIAMGGSFQYDVAPVIAPFKYHARWKELEAKDLYQKPGNKRPKKCFKGFLYETKNSHYKPDPNFMQTDIDGVKEIQKSVKADIKEIVSMCNKRGVKVVLLTLPSANTWTMPKHNAVEKIAKDNNLLYLDLNVKKEDFNFDFANSFRDWGNHMNYYGAKQSTDYIVKFLNSNFELENHKEDKKYESWNDLLLTFQDYKNKHQGVYE